MARSARSPIASVVLTLALLVALVWALAPDRASFKPAALRPEPLDCTQVQPDFVPSNVTELPGTFLEGLSPVLKNRALLRLNMEPCACRCRVSVAFCLVNNPRCEASKELARKIIAEVAKESRP